MKAKLKSVFIRIINTDMLWAIIKPFAVLGFFAHHNRKKKLVEINTENFPFLSIFNTKQVLHGPFKGMKYPSLIAAGSALYPKLMGCYEKELHPIITRILAKNYTEILDIGCAEGYYAVGLGMKINSTKIYAYDTDETARNLCLEMARINHIEDKIILEDTCTPQVLEKFKFSGRSLIICDCEGYEKLLFNSQNIKNLINSDLLIEAHDFIDLNISDYLVNLFSQTHHILIIKSIDDIEKAKTYAYKETTGLSLEEKLLIYREWRPSIMEWIYCTPQILPE